MIDRKNKSYSFKCPCCKAERKVTYAQSWNIKSGNSTGKCRTCVAPKNGKPSAFAKGHKAWNKEKLGYKKGHPCYYKAFGSDNKNWKGGKELARGNEYRKWRKQVLEKDDYTCQLCERNNVKLQADHIKSWAFYPELRYELSNGRALCLECHKSTDNYAGRAGTRKELRL